MKKKKAENPKPTLPDLRMSGTEFDRVMGKALGVAPQPQKPAAKRRKR